MYLVAWILLVACGEDSPVVDDAAWTLPDHAGCTWEQTVRDGYSDEIVDYALVGFDARGWEDRWVRSSDGRTFREEEADWDDNGCRTRWLDRMVWDDEVDTEMIATGACSDDGSHGLATGTFTDSAGEVWDYAEESQRVLEQGFPVLITRHTRVGNQDTPMTYRNSLDWLDGRQVGLRVYQLEDFKYVQRWEYDAAGFVTYEVVGDEDWEEHTLYTRDEHGRPTELLVAADAEGTERLEVLTYRWNAEQYTFDLVTWDWDADGTVDIEAPYTCTEGWPWSCTGEWWEPDVDRLAWTETFTWTCGGAP